MTFVNNISKLQFYEDTTCKPIVTKLNFIILKPDPVDFPNLGNSSAIDDSFINSLKNNSNIRWNEIDHNGDDMKCDRMGLTYPVQSHNWFDYQVFTEIDTDAWDYYAQAKSTPFYSQNSFTPDRIAHPTTNLWPAISRLALKYQQLYPDRISVFFVENGARLSYYQNAIDSGQDIPLPWFDYTTDTTHTKIFSGASFSPLPYHDSHPREFVIMANVQSEYFGRVNFGHVESPTWQPSNFFKGEVWKWDVAGLLNHELADSLALSHLCGCENLMERCDLSEDYFLNLEQLEVLQRGLSVTSSHKYVKCSELADSNCNIETTGNAIMDIPMSVYGDIIVKSGHTLTLKSEVFLSEESTIDVESGGKLIIDGGILTTGCEFDTWEGIRVVGGNSDYDVKIINGALIENTRKHAVSMFPPNIPWPEIQNFGNGILIAENSTFLNCDALAGFVAFSPSSNKSRIVNCTHTGGKWGVTNWQSEGVILDNCTFEDISEHCIGAYDGTYDLTNNDFYGGTSEVLFTNTKAGKISTIKNNIFNTAPIGLRAMGSHTGFLDIENNTFNTSDIGILMELINNYDIVDNIFNGAEYGVYCQQNGVDLVNNINGNIFTGNEKGIRALLDNDKLSFLRNCFSTNSVDVEIFGLVAEFMGGSRFAGNCFTHKGSVSSNTIDIGGSPKKRDNVPYSFIYNEPNDTYDNCIDAVKTSPLFPLVTIDDTKPGGGKDFCGPSDPDQPEEPCDDTEDNIPSLRQAIIDVQNTIQFILDSDLNEKQKRKEIYTPDRCIGKFRSQLYNLYLENEEFVEAQNLYSPAQNFDDHIAVFSAMLAEGDLDKAAIYLNAIPVSSSAESDFILIQELNISRLQHGPNYNPPPSQLSNLFSISERKKSYAGFAKSLYFQLTGELAPFEIYTPEPTNEVDARLNNQEQSLVKQFSVYPNPFNNILNVDLIGYEGLHIKISNISGETIFEEKINNNSLKLTTSNWSPGIYIVQIIDDNELIERKKIVLLK